MNVFPGMLIVHLTQDYLFYEPAIISLLPMFTENAHSVAMIQHLIKGIQSAVKHVNPSQVPVTAFDQPLFAIAKQLQWTNGNEFGEDKFVFMLGGLHIEMSFLNVLGKWLTESGWAEMIINAEVARSGVADSFMKGKHVTRTRRAHQVTAACLHTLMTNAYKANTEDATLENIECPSFKEWREKQESKSPQFLYWSRVLDLQLCLLRLIRSFREGNFKLYIESIKEMLPWVFALDHQNYARWLSVHLRDMLELSQKHPDIHQEFTRGSFVVHKTQKPFCSIALDHAHEQVNAVVKGEGGAVGLTDSPDALLRWMVSGPEVSRMVEEFESSVKTIKNDNKHHEQTPAAQSKFLEDVQNLISAFEESGNPFLDKSKDFTALHTKDVMDDDVVKSVRNVKDVGEKQFKSFVKERLVERKLAITEPLKKNNLNIISTQSKKVVSKDKAKVKELKEDCELFSRLFIACQSREGNLDEFFTFENQPWPPSLAQSGKLRSGQKADLIKCILNQAADPPSNFQADAVILDGAVIVQMLPVKTARTFDEYFNAIFAPYVLHQLETANRVDLVFDEYRKDSLKAATREKRGSGQRRRVLPNALIPCDWKGFLRVDENKTELFRYLSEKVAALPLPDGKVVYSTSGPNVLSTLTTRENMDRIQPCTHEEADTRLLLHALDAQRCGYQHIKIRSNDTDVVVLAVSSERHFVNILKGPYTKVFSYGVRRSLPSQFCPVCLTGDGSLMIKVGPPIGHHYHKLRTYAMS
ncbi:uncharacterized protein LOC122958628 [Acropora millepora]|uniref:uncharacterized protein LOC122958628 n=1 Tax=Acropora millepora TaxID=45264 RepID=UPI001CF35FF1|nr:uncharacterized protein LOC122958628 [Acropora millepora]